MSILMPLIWITIVVVLIALLICSVIKIVPQASAYVVERLGAYMETWDVGLHFKVPLIDRIANKVDLREQVADFPPQPVITKDNVTMQIDTVIYYQITDPKLYTYGVENPISAIENLTATTLRNIIGDMELDKTLTSRDDINTQMRSTLDEATDPWGIKINRVELKNIQPPHSIQEAMEKQMKAERERREKILRAEGEQRSTVLIAQGRTEAQVLQAKADRESTVVRAQGEAEAIKTIQQATAEGLEVLSRAGISDEVLRLKAIEAFGKAADGKATKIIIPSDLQSFTGLAQTITSTIRTPEPAAEESAEDTAPKE